MSVLVSMPEPGENLERKRFTAAQAGCVGALALLLVLLVVFFALPFVWRSGWTRGRFLAFRGGRSASPGTVMPQGLTSFPTVHRGRPATVHILRLGSLFWVVQVPR